MSGVNERGETMALRVGTLVSVRHASGAPAAALVVAADSASVTLHVSGHLPGAETEHVVLAFGARGQMQEREARVLAIQSTSQEIRIEAFGSPLPDDERRTVERFDAMGAAELTIGDQTYHGRLTDVSVLGAGLDVAMPGPETIEEGALIVRDALGPLLPATRVRVAYRHHPTGARVRIGVEFADPRGVADATRRLIDQLNSREAR
ncbi:MAG TPA: PilZ domain-containing protein [Gaiellales bacterium]